MKIKVPQDQAEIVISSLKHRFPQIEVKYTLRDPPGQKLLKIKNVTEREIIDFVKLFKDIKFCFETDDYPEKEEITMSEPNQQPKGKFAQMMLLALSEQEKEASDAQDRINVIIKNIEQIKIQAEAAAKKFQEDAQKKLGEVDASMQEKFKSRDQNFQALQQKQAIETVALGDRLTKVENKVSSASKSLGG